MDKGVRIVETARRVFCLNMSFDNIYGFEGPMGIRGGAGVFHLSLMALNPSVSTRRST